MTDRYERAPEHDRRIGRGDDFAGDAWRDTATGEIRWVAVGHTPNEQEKREAPVLEMLAPDRDGMRVNIVGLLRAISDSRGGPCGIDRALCDQLVLNLEELARRFYAGDVRAVDEFLQLYSLDEHRPKPRPEIWTG